MERLTCLLVVVLAAAGCSKKPTPVTVEVLDWEATGKLVAGKRGQVVVVDVWSTVCVPCLREFPNLVDLHARYGDKGLACVSVNCDYLGIATKPPKFYRDRVLAVLRKQGATFDNVLLSVPADDFFTEIDLGSIPAVFVYGRDGKLAKRFDNDSGEYGDEGFTYREHIIPLVEKLLAPEAGG